MANEQLKYEFETMEEFQKAMKNLSNYHDCEKCHNKMVAISFDPIGGTKCGYCGEYVKYPKMKKESFEKALTTRRLKNNLFDYLAKNNPAIIDKYDGNKMTLSNILKLSSTFLSLFSHSSIIS